MDVAGCGCHPQFIRSIRTNSGFSGSLENFTACNIAYIHHVANFICTFEQFSDDNSAIH